MSPWYGKRIAAILRWPYGHFVGEGVGDILVPNKFKKKHVCFNIFCSSNVGVMLLVSAASCELYHLQPGVLSGSGSYIFLHVED